MQVIQGTTLHSITSLGTEKELIPLEHKGTKMFFSGSAEAYYNRITSTEYARARNGQWMVWTEGGYHVELATFVSQGGKWFLKQSGSEESSIGEKKIVVPLNLEKVEEEVTIDQLQDHESLKTLTPDSEDRKIEPTKPNEPENPSSIEDLQNKFAAGQKEKADHVEKTEETKISAVLSAAIGLTPDSEDKKIESTKSNEPENPSFIEDLQNKSSAWQKEKTDDVKTPVAPAPNGPKFKGVFSVAAAVSGVALGLLAAIVILRDTICRESQSKFKKFTVSCAAVVAAFALSIVAVVQAAFKTLALIAISAITAGDKPKWLISFKAKHLVLAPVSLCVAAKLAFNTLIHTWKFNTPIFENKIIGEKAVEEFTAKKEAELSLRNPKTLYVNARKLLNESWIGSLKRAAVTTS